MTSIWILYDTVMCGMYHPCM